MKKRSVFVPINVRSLGQFTNLTAVRGGGGGGGEWRDTKREEGKKSRRKRSAMTELVLLQVNPLHCRSRFPIRF